MKEVSKIFSCRLPDKIIAAASWLNDVASTVSTGVIIMVVLLTTLYRSATLSGTASNLQPLIDGGAGTYTLAQLEGG